MTALEQLIEVLNNYVNEPVDNDSQFDYCKGMAFGKILAQERIKAILDIYDCGREFEERYDRVTRTA